MGGGAYADALAYLFGRLNYERVAMPRAAGELRLARMRRLLKRLGDPQKAYRIVHIAGTKGKGSTSNMVATALGAKGLRVGLYCSPHLHRIEERFAVDGREASPGELIGLVEAMRPVVEEHDRSELSIQQRPLTFFEITTAMGLLHFARRGARVVVLEVGLGGRLDSTNAVRPDVAVITSISFDHTRQLGNTLGAIAGEKAGILKRGGVAVSGVRGTEACGVIERIARQRRVTLRRIDREFTGVYEPAARPLVEPAAGEVVVRTWRRTWRRKRVPLLGAHQATNAAVALAALDALGEVDAALDLDDATVERGWSELRVAARVEVVSKRPWLVIDGAHNVASAEALAETLTTSFPATRRTLVFGTTRDKDLKGQLRALLPLFECVVATKYLENPRAVACEDVAQACRDLGARAVLVAQNPREAIETARRVTAANELICVTGSMFLAAEARAVVIQ